MVTGYNPRDFASKAKFKAMIDVDPNELKKNDLKINLKVKSDANYFLTKFFKKLKKYNFKSDWISYCTNIRKKYPILIDKMINEKRYVNSYYFVDTLSKLTKKNDLNNYRYGLLFHYKSSSI